MRIRQDLLYRLQLSVSKDVEKIEIAHEPGNQSTLENNNTECRSPFLSDPVALASFGTTPLYWLTVTIQEASSCMSYKFLLDDYPIWRLSSKKMQAMVPLQ